MIAGMFQHPFEAGRMLRGLLGPRDCAPLPRLGENGGFYIQTTTFNTRNTIEMRLAKDDLISHLLATEILCL